MDIEDRIHMMSEEIKTKDRERKLLDYFAGQALAGSVEYEAMGNVGYDRMTPKTMQAIALDCYDLAAAMLAERERRQHE